MPTSDSSPASLTEGLRERLRLSRMALGLIWEAAPRWTAVWAILIVIQGMLPAATVALTKWVVDAVAAAVGSGLSAETVAPVLLPAVLVGLVMMLERVLGGLSEWVGTGQSEHVGDYIKARIHEKAAAVDYAFYESPAYHDLLEQVNSQGTGRVLQLLQNGGGFVRSTVTAVSIGVILMTYSVWVPLALVVSAAPAFLVVIRHNQIYHAWWKEATSRRRLVSYYDLMLTQDMAAAEVRISRLGVPFRKRYRETRADLRDERLDLLRRQVLARFGAAFTALLVTAVVMVWIARRALVGEATLGDLAMFYSAFTQGQSILGSLLQNAGSVYTNTLFLQHLFDFFAIDDDVKDPTEPAPFPDPIREGVRFEDVEFAYPASSRKALQGFDLFVEAGKTTAVVGENGAGKSTFIKLLCRFYDPDRGRITVDGTDLRRFRQAEVRRRIAVLFQFPMRFQLPAAENIALGDLDVEPTPATLRRAAEAAGADSFLDRLPSGFQTILGRWFSTGSELSGGEWQRVALARAFYRRAPLVILDEPTSFMDSWAENAWLDRFERLVKGRTALVITHRFTTAMRADVIHVMDQGRIVESGSHAELLALGGRYASSWQTQMRQADKAASVVVSGDGGSADLRPYE